jgi:hypothetical protein
MMARMESSKSDWIVLASYENLPGCPAPMAIVRA